MNLCFADYIIYILFIIYKNLRFFKFFRIIPIFKLTLIIITIEFNTSFLVIFLHILKMDVNCFWSSHFFNYTPLYQESPCQVLKLYDIFNMTKLTNKRSNYTLCLKWTHWLSGKDYINATLTQFFQLPQKQYSRV